MVHLVLEQCAIVVSAFPNDLKLPGLQHLTDTGERKQLLSELLPDQPSVLGQEQDSTLELHLIWQFRDATGA